MWNNNLNDMSISEYICSIMPKVDIINVGNILYITIFPQDGVHSGDLDLWNWEGSTACCFASGLECDAPYHHHCHMELLETQADVSENGRRQNGNLVLGHMMLHPWIVLAS